MGQKMVSMADCVAPEETEAARVSLGSSKPTLEEFKEGELRPQQAFTLAKFNSDAGGHALGSHVVHAADVNPFGVVSEDSVQLERLNKNSVVGP